MEKGANGCYEYMEQCVEEEEAKELSSLLFLHILSYLSKGYDRRFQIKYTRQKTLVVTTLFERLREKC